MIWVLQNSYFCQLLCCKLIPGLITNKYLHSPCGRNFFEYFEKKIIQLLTRKLQIPIFSKINGNTLKIDGMQSHDLILNLGFKVLQTGTPRPPSSIPPRILHNIGVMGQQQDLKPQPQTLNHLAKMTNGFMLI